MTFETHAASFPYHCSQPDPGLRGISSCSGVRSQDTTAGKMTDANSKEPTEDPAKNNVDTNAASTEQSELKTTDAIEVFLKAGRAGLTFQPDGMITKVYPRTQAE